MADSIIKVDNISKQYKIGLTGDVDDFREAVSNYVRSFFQKKQVVQEKSNEIWALKDVSFDVKQGEVMGLVGKNGAGKSTLLKILSRITEPTEGRITIKGRVASLLEVGTGFHPELTGRENIFMNGSILGMKRAEIRAKFDEIVGFSGISKFIDTPVKRYSSGMYVRLAFAVAAHLDPEIMIIDEVLAVGDAEFQKKCLGKMHNISNQGGRTVLFVSHNMAAVNALCHRAILLEQGVKTFEGLTGQVVGKYLLTGDSGESDRCEWRAPEEEKDASLYLEYIRIKDSTHTTRGEFFSREEVFVEMEVVLREEMKDLKIGFDVKTLSYGMLFRTMCTDTDNLVDEGVTMKPGRYKLTAKIPRKVLNTNIYYITPRISIHRKKILLEKDYLISFRVIFELPNTTHLTTQRPGIISPVLEWHTATLQRESL